MKQIAGNTLCLVKTLVVTDTAITVSSSSDAAAATAEVTETASAAAAAAAVTAGKRRLTGFYNLVISTSIVTAALHHSQRPKPPGCNASNTVVTGTINGTDRCPFIAIQTEAEIVEPSTNIVRYICVQYMDMGKESLKRTRTSIELFTLQLHTL